MYRAILEIFAEAARIPSHTQERRVFRHVLRDRDRRGLKLEQDRWQYASNFRRSLFSDSLPWVCACVLCGRHFGHEQGLLSHLRYWRYQPTSCASATAQAAE